MVSIVQQSLRKESAQEISLGDVCQHRAAGSRDLHVEITVPSSLKQSSSNSTLGARACSDIVTTARHRMCTPPSRIGCSDSKMN